ncbi:unnamed protein product [Phytomonas sp. Hart1]|nr:unnamed protein product [Phytomonas sp. Hart1]|eukprot:CCW72354.1 unnamed protein product [Phytomonas sp. isolate Hart1]
MVLPAGIGFSLDLTLNDLRCKPNTYNYSAQSNIFNVSNLRVSNAGDMGRLFNIKMSLSASAIFRDNLNTFIANLIESVPKDTGSTVFAGVVDSASDKGGGDDKRFFVSMPAKVSIVSYPSFLIVVVYIIGSALATVYLVILNVMRHRVRPVVHQGTLKPVSVVRIILEDMLLSISCFACAGAFIWFNLTTPVHASLGGELHIYGFTLMDTVCHFWDIGMQPLSVFLFLFSYIWPYVKLTCMLLFALVLQRPHARILRIIDYVGKFSFLDTFVIHVMLPGIFIPELGGVVILPSFYLYIGATITSVLLGNYTVRLWRRGTTLMKCGEGGLGPQCGDDEVSEGSRWNVCNPLYLEDEVQLSSESSIISSDNSNFATKVRPEISKSPMKERWYVNVIIFCVMLSCLLPAWFLPCLRCRMGGIAPLITSEYKEYSLYQLCNTLNPVFFVVFFFTLFIAPCGYALSRKWFSFLASWSAVDVFLLSCIAGLIRLNECVQYMLKPRMEGMYTSHATPLWPLVLFLVASVLQWMLVAVELQHVNIRKSWIKVRRLTKPL